MTSNGTVPPPTPPAPPPPTVVINGMQTGAQGSAPAQGAGGSGSAGSATGNCSTIRLPGDSGGGPSNCGNNVPASGGTSQFPGSGMAASGQPYSRRPYYNSGGWRFNPDIGLWQNPKDASQTSSPGVIQCCDETGLGFPSDAVNQPQDAAAGSASKDGCALPPWKLRQVLGYMNLVASRTHAYPSQIAAAIRKAGGPNCGVPSLANCMRASLADKPAPFGCPHYNSSQDQSEQPDTGVTADAAQPPPADPEPGPQMSEEDEAYCNYMASGIVRGELTPATLESKTAIPAECKATIAAAKALQAKRKAEGAPPPFTVDPAETAEEIKRLLGPYNN